MSSATLAIPQGGINYNGNSNLGYQNAGDYTIVTNTGSVGAISPYNNQNYPKTLVSKETGGTLLINPRTNDLLNLNVGNLENGKTYKVHFRISNYGTIEGPKAHQDQNYNCDWTGNSMMVGVVIKGGNGGNSDNGNQVNNAKITRTQMTGVSAADAPYVCNKDLNNNISWDVNNGGQVQCFPGQSLDYYVDYKPTEGGMRITFQAKSWTDWDVYGLDLIEITGDVTQQIIPDNGTQVGTGEYNVSEGYPVVLTADGLGSVSDDYVWTKNGVPVSGQYGSTLQIIPSPGENATYEVYNTKYPNDKVCIVTHGVDSCDPASGVIGLSKTCMTSSSPASIDGNANEGFWSSAPWQSITYTGDTSNDCNGFPAVQWKAAFDDNYFYFYAEIPDNPSAGNGNDNQGAYANIGGDAFEIYLGGTGSSGHQYGFAYKGNNQAMSRYQQANNSSVSMAKTTGSGWSCEIQIPLNGIINTSVENPSKLLNFEVAYNWCKNNDGNRTCQRTAFGDPSPWWHGDGDKLKQDMQILDCTKSRITDPNNNGAIISTSCKGQGVDLTSRLNLGGSHQWKYSINSGASWTNVPGGNAHDISVDPSSLLGGNGTGVIYFKLVENGNVEACPVALTVSNVEILSAAVNPSPTCEGGDVTFTATVDLHGNSVRKYGWNDAPTVIGGHWLTDSSVGGTSALQYTINGVKPADGQDQADNTKPRNYYFIIDGACAAVSDPVPLKVNDVPQITVKNASICEGNPTGVTLASLVTSNPSNADVKWYNAATGGTVVTAMPTQTTTLYAEPSFAGSCPGTRQPSLITVVKKPALNTIDPQTICNGDAFTSVTLSGTGVGYCEWKATANNTNHNNETGTGLTINGVAVNLQNPANIGTLAYTITPYTDNTKTCSGTNRSLTINVNLTNTVSAASSTPTLCVNTAISPNITHTTTNATGIGAPTGLPNGVTAVWNNNTITISGTPTATGEFNYSIPLTGGCGTVNATGKITVVEVPDAPNVDGKTICSGTTATLTAPTVAGITYTWYTAETGGTGTTGNSFTTPSLTNNTTYYVSQKNTTCESTRTAVEVEVLAKPTVNTIQTQPICDGESFTTVNLSGNNATTYRWTAQTAINVTKPADGEGQSIAGIALSLNDAEANGNLIYKITPYNVKNTLECAGNTTNFVVNITKNNTVTNAPADPNICLGANVNMTHTTTGATGIGAATGLPAGVTANWNNNTITISGTPTEVGKFNYEIPLTGGCGDVKATGKITVKAIPTIKVTDIQCSADRQSYSGTIDISAGTAEIVSGTGAAIAGNTLTAPKDVNVTLKVTSNGCSSENYNVTAPNCDCPVIPSPVDASTAHEYCSDKTVPTLSVTATLEADQIVEWFESADCSGTAVATGLSYTPNAAQAPLAGAEKSYYARIRNTVDQCVSNVTEVKLKNNQAPTVTVEPAAAVCEPGSIDIATTGRGADTYKYYSNAAATDEITNTT
ncbi:MAG: hypothetical protein IKR52_09075, partial [Paludibacteraceae bacterium]|nr:hypothetical protein [Paludibacteraceae bacterium]